MVRLLADENFHGDILRGLLRVEPKLDILRVQDTKLYQAANSAVLDWAASEDRILLTHDVQDDDQTCLRPYSSRAAHARRNRSP